MLMLVLMTMPLLLVLLHSLVSAKNEHSQCGTVQWLLVVSELGMVLLVFAVVVVVALLMLD